MNERIERALADLKARQQAGEHMACPRCGRDTMKTKLATNALSRHAEGIYICDECGTTEALLDFMQRPLPIEDWAVFRARRQRSGLEALPGQTVWERIRLEHGPVLIRLYERWQREQPDADFRAIREEAFERCPGLTELWEAPFQAKYSVADGELLLRFRKTDDGTEISADLLSKGR